MLVLDDVWDENWEEWERLKTFLERGAAQGSKILITTRNLTFGKIMGTVSPYILQPLNDEDSWSLFEKIAFRKVGHEPGMMEIGKDILRLCKNVPLAIRAIASVLANKLTVQEWSSFRTDELPKLEIYGSNIMPILKLSYDYLEPKLKACFSYCSVFPRGYLFDGNKLINLWIAQGFVKTPSRSHSLEDEGKEYLDELMNKGLLQGYDNESNSTCKLHDLMYDLSCSVANGQCEIMSSWEENSSNNSIRHMAIDYKVDSSWEVPVSVKSMKQLRTLIWVTTPWRNWVKEGSSWDCFISSFRSLRTLDLHNLAIKEVPKSVGKLIHLRYLDLSHNDGLGDLPDSITLLHNLQYLDISGTRLSRLPKDMKRLVNLRHLQLDSLLHLPSGLGNLTNLQTLDTFVVDGDPMNYYRYKRTDGARLSDLNHLNNLRGALRINVNGLCPGMSEDAWRANLKGKMKLESVTLAFTDCNFPSLKDDCELVLEYLQPNDNILTLTINGYGGIKLPTWMATNQLSSSVSNLASLFIESCPNVKHLPSFAQLRNLKSLSFSRLPNVVYIEETHYETSSSSSSVVLFPSLTKLSIHYMDKLKGWSRSTTSIAESQSFPRVFELKISCCPSLESINLAFPCISELQMNDCPRLESLPWCPNLESLTISSNLKEDLWMWQPNGTLKSSLAPKLKTLIITILTGGVRILASLPRDLVREVLVLNLNFVSTDFKELRAMGPLALRGMTSLRTLKLHSSYGFMPLSVMAHQLQTLERLEFQAFDISGAYDNKNDFKEWKVLKNLRSVKFEDVYSSHDGPRSVEIQSLLRGFQNITTLESLELITLPCVYGAIPGWIGNLQSLSKLEFRQCRSLYSFPEEMRKLTNLKLLVIDDCPKLAERCQKETGEDWPKIQHVSNVIIRTLS